MKLLESVDDTVRVQVGDSVLVRCCGCHIFKPDKGPGYGVCSICYVEEFQLADITNIDNRRPRPALETLQQRFKMRAYLPLFVVSSYGDAYRKITFSQPMQLDAAYKANRRALALYYAPTMELLCV